MNNSKLPKKSILTGASALYFYGFIPCDTSKRKTIAMKRGTNTSTYKDKYIISTQKEEILTLGKSRTSNFPIYIIERLYIELEKFNLDKATFIAIEYALSNQVNKKIVLELATRLKGIVRGVDWKRIDSFLKETENSLEDIKDKKELLKKMIKEVIYSVSKIELPTLTFLDTEKVIENLPTSNLRPSEIQTITSLRNAFEFLISFDGPFSLEFMKSVNYQVAKNQVKNAGSIRETEVIIGGSLYIPSIPTTKSVTKFFNEISIIKDNRLRAATFVAKATKLQLFYDGNKRTAIVVANKILIDSGAGILSIHEKSLPTYFKLLNEYYENENKESDFIAFIEKNIFSNHSERIKKLKEAGIIK